MRTTIYTANYDYYYQYYSQTCKLTDPNLLNEIKGRARAKTFLVADQTRAFCALIKVSFSPFALISVGSSEIHRCIIILVVLRTHHICLADEKEIEISHKTFPTVTASADSSDSRFCEAATCSDTYNKHG